MHFVFIVLVLLSKTSFIRFFSSVRFSPCFFATQKNKEKTRKPENQKTRKPENQKTRKPENQKTRKPENQVLAYINLDVVYVSDLCK
jgi:hypothetical protein